MELIQKYGKNEFKSCSKEDSMLAILFRFTRYGGYELITGKKAPLLPTEKDVYHFNGISLLITPDFIV